eukprot:gene8685-8866_t
MVGDGKLDMSLDALIKKQRQQKPVGAKAKLQQKQKGKPGAQQKQQPGAAAGVKGKPIPLQQGKKGVPLKAKGGVGKPGTSLRAGPGKATGAQQKPGQQRLRQTTNVRVVPRPGAKPQAGINRLVSNLDFKVTDEDIKVGPQSAASYKAHVPAAMQTSSVMSALQPATLLLPREMGGNLMPAVVAEQMSSGRSLGTATVIYERRQDALAAFNRYNNVALDNKKMSIEVVETAVPRGTFKTLSSGINVSRLQQGGGGGGGARGRGVPQGDMMQE